MNPKELTNKGAVTKPRDRDIMVTINSNTLYNLPYPPTEAQIDANTYLVDDEGLESRFGESNKNFETLVFSGKEMIWAARSFEPLGVDRDYSVSLQSVSQNQEPGNSNFFVEATPLPVSRDGKIHGTIATFDRPIPDDSYTINFLITYRGETRTYPLDPKLRLNQ